MQIFQYFYFFIFKRIHIFQMLKNLFRNFGFHFNAKFKNVQQFHDRFTFIKFLDQIRN